MSDIMKYNLGKGDKENWIVTESRFEREFLGKCESIFALGNGYMGLRSAMEEGYDTETRNLFVAGSFNKFSDNEVTELPNVADVLWFELKINGEKFNLADGEIIAYERRLDLKDAHLIREVTWKSPKGETYELRFSRYVSFADKHVIAMKIEVTAVDTDAVINFTSGINARVTNSGSQHFIEGDYRFYDDKKFMQLTKETTQSHIKFVITGTHDIIVDNTEIFPEQHINMDRRRMYSDYEDIKLYKGVKMKVEKIITVFTSRDNDITDDSLEGLKTHALKHIKTLACYEGMLEDHIKAWDNKVWGKNPIKITSSTAYDQLAIRFAKYHMHVMTPAHDNRMNIGAKGLSGEGYKGHTFWDTELFLLPYFTYSYPDVARSLLEYRYLTLAGAHKKAKENGYEGAMFPWESAWMDDGEVTPVWGAADIVTGKSTKIMSGFIEQHITSDIAFATWQYYQITHDEDFMKKYGYELILDTAKFWSSRLEYNEVKGQYHINCVIGPDEYKEHVDNNAFTNYMAHWNIKMAMGYYTHLQANEKELFDQLNKKMELDKTYKGWTERVDKIYLPAPRPEDNVIPQDDTYLSKEIIDLTKYKNQENVGSMFKDYSLDQVNEIQVSKQADIMIMFYLLENLFSKEIKEANWNYYEPKTLHDSSLSLSTHSILANDMKDYQMSYKLFKEATEIDLGPNMKTSDAGIHAASLGGIWQCVVNGFGGLRMIEGKLRISPKLPTNWTELEYGFNWAGDSLLVNITPDKMKIKKLTGTNEKIAFIVNEKDYEIKDEIEIML